MTTIHYERIFTNSEIQDLEHQIKYLMSKQKEIKTHVKEEFKKLQLRLEKEIMDAQQQGKDLLAKSIEKASELCQAQAKRQEEEIDKDHQLLQEQCDHLANLRYEKDYWKELELKGVIGDAPQPSYDEFCKDCDKNFEQSKGHIDKKLRLIRRLIDNEQMEDIIEVLKALQQTVEEDEPPVTPREPQKDNEKIAFKNCVYGTYITTEPKALSLIHLPEKDTSEQELSHLIIVLQPDDKIALKTAAHGKYLSATESGSLEQRDEITSKHELFTMIIDDDLDVDKFAFKTSFGRFISANDKGKVVQAIQCNESEWWWKIYPDMKPEDEPQPVKKEEEEPVAPIEDDM